MDKRTELIGIIQKAIDEFNKYETYLIKNELSERCICSKFACYIEKTLYDTPYANYNVDVEYNRGLHDNQIAKKAIGSVKRATVDLIVHKRGTHDNLICIEMKKSSKEYYLKNDKKRLKIMTENGHFNYFIGFMLVAENEKLSINTIF